MSEPLSVVPNRPDIVTVTNDNIDTFVDQQLGVKPATNPDPEAAAKEQLAKTEAEKKARLADDDSEHDLEGVEPSKKDAINERFRKITAKRKEAETKLAESERAHQEELETVRKEAKALREKYEPPPPDDLGPEPQPEQFTDLAEYKKAIKDWTKNTTLKEQATERQAQEEKSRAAENAKAWEKKLAAAREELPDFDSRMEGGVPLTPEMRAAVIESDIGPRLLLAIKEEVGLAEKLGKMTVAGMLREIGKMEARLEKVQAPARKIEISKAPEPINPIKGGGGDLGVVLSGNDNFHGTYEEYKAARQSGKIK